MKRVLNMLRAGTDRRFMRDTLLLSSGMVTAQLLMLAAMPVWARLYTPADFGVLGLWTAVAGIVSVVVVLRLDTCIVVAPDDTRARTLTQLCLWLAAGGASVIALMSALLPVAVLRPLGLAALGPWLPVAVLAGGLAAAVSALQFAANRRSAYGRMTLSRIALAGVAALAGIGLGAAGVGAGMLLAHAAASLAAWLVLTVGVAASQRIGPPWADRHALTAAVRANANAPRYLWPAALLDVLTQQLPLLLIAGWYSQALAGQFSLAWRVIAVPLFMLAAAAGSVFFQRMSLLADRPAEARQLLVGTWRLFALLGALPAIGVMVWGEPLFAVVFGSEWAPAGRMAAVLMPMLWVMLVSVPTSSTLIVLGLQKWSLLFGLAMLVYRPLAFWLGARQGDLERGLWLWVVCEVFVIALYNLLILRGLRSLHRLKQLHPESH